MKANLPTKLNELFVLYNDAIGNENINFAEQLEQLINSCFQSANQILQRHLVESTSLEHFSNEIQTLIGDNVTSVFLMSTNVQLMVLYNLSNMDGDSQQQFFHAQKDSIIKLWNIDVIEPQILIRIVYLFSKMAQFVPFLISLLFRRTIEVGI